MGIEMMEPFKISKNPTKEIFTVQTSDGKYFGVIQSDNDLHVLPQAFDSPLKASNAARSAKKKFNIQMSIVSDATQTTPKPIVKKGQDAEEGFFRTTIRRAKNLYSETEMKEKPYLRFREVWLIVSPAGTTYVKRSLCSGVIAEYSKNQEKAEVFKSYEDAVYRLNTLDMVLKKGHKLRRFYWLREGM
jgi:hypothetical protein